MTSPKVSRGLQGPSWHEHHPLWAYFLTPEVGWVVGAGGTVLLTQDGGGHWVDQNTGTQNVLYAVYASDVRRVTAAGAVGTILSSDNGGESWGTHATRSSATLFDVVFPDAANGWAVGNLGAMFHTTDGGQHWEDRILPCLGSRTKPNDLIQIRFTDADTGWIVGE